MLKRVISLLLIASVLLVGAGSMVYLRVEGRLAPPERFSQLPAWADHAVDHLLSGIGPLRELAPSLLLTGGVKEQDGIFITKDYLLENVTPGDPSILESNLAGIEAFLADRNIPAVLMLVPTACAIKQQELPASAQLYNQKALIDSVYARFSGQITTVDLYGPLYAAKEQYTYYRTASNLTGLGGYYVYVSLMGRLGLSYRTLDQFEIEHLREDYYGDLYERSSFKGIDPDIVTIYIYNFQVESDRHYRRYKLTHTLPEGQKSYYTLFPHHLAALEGPDQVILGGFSPRIDVISASPYEESLLILGDKAALSYLPFLMVHYERITLIDLERAAPDELAALNCDEYDQVIFSYSVDSFINRPVSAAAGLLP